MNVFFRADASESIGTGHLMRCLVLADAVASQGGHGHFIVRNWNTVSRRILDNTPHGVSSLDLPDTCDALEDARRCLEVLQAQPGAIDWLVVDHYGLDARWETLVGSAAASLLVIDDLADRPHDCDVLVDPGLGRQVSAYAAWLPARAQTLLGSPYAILKPAYAQHHGSAPRWPQTRRAHVFFGGGSSAAWLPACVEALMDVEPALEVFAVGICDEAAMQGLEARHGSRLTWSRHEADMAPHYARCSVAVGSPGTATWERACIGLPSALMATASNQVPILEQLDRQGLCRYLGPAWEWHTPTLTDRLRAFLQDSASLAAMRALGTASIDGRGAERIVKRLRGPGALDA